MYLDLYTCLPGYTVRHNRNIKLLQTSDTELISWVAVMAVPSTSHTIHTHMHAHTKSQQDQ